MYTRLVAWDPPLSEPPLFVLSLPLCAGAPAASAERGCHRALGSMRLGMFHLISLTSPVSGGAERRRRRREAGGDLAVCRTKRADTMFAWGPCSRRRSPRHCLPACKTMKARRLTDSLSCSHFEWQQRRRAAKSGSGGGGPALELLCSQLWLVKPLQSGVRTQPCHRFCNNGWPGQSDGPERHTALGLNGTRCLIEPRS